MSTITTKDGTDICCTDGGQGEVVVFSHGQTPSAEACDAQLHLRFSHVIPPSVIVSECIVGPTLSALDHGYGMHAMVDSCGGASSAAHDRAMERMIQEGVRSRRPCDTRWNISVAGQGPGATTAPSASAVRMA